MVAPATRGLIDREDLVAALDLAAARRVTTISAPAGSGKTSLLRAWAARAGRGLVVLVQVPRGQPDAQAFWLSVQGALHGARAPTEAVLAPVGTPEFDGDAMVERVLAELADLTDAGGEVTLILDDLHELGPPEAFAQLRHLLEDLPPGVHAIVATRRDLRLGLHRMRLDGELGELRATDLQFTDTEVHRMLAAAGIRLSDAGVDLLRQRTEGWAAGLRLAVISLTGDPDPERFVADFSGTDRTVAEYLLAEMLERQPADVQQVLLRTSILERVNGELADLLTGRPGAERILLDLEDANAFVVSLDAARTWFRYHHLFADLLRLELRRTLPEEMPSLHRRAAEWFVEHGQIAEAVGHTQAAGDWDAAARLLADHSFSLTLDGQAQTIEALLRAFPPGASAYRAELAIAQAASELAQGRLDQAAVHLTLAEDHVATTPLDRRRRLRVAIASLKVSLARRRGSLTGVREQVDVLTAPMSGQSDDDIALSSDLRAVALMNLGIVEAWSMGTPEAERHLREGAELARENDRPYLEVACLAQLAFASKIHSFATTRRLCHEAIALAGRYGWGGEPIVAPALLTLAVAMAWTGDFDGSEHWLDRTDRALRSDTGPGIGLLLHIGTGMLHAGRGHLLRALEEFGAAEHLRAQLEGSHALASQVTGWLIATQARLGTTGQARATLGELDDERAQTGEVQNARVAISLAEGDPAAALLAVTPVLDGRAPVVGYLTVIEAHLLAAVAHRELGDHRAANQAAERALSLAEPDRVILPFVTTGAGDVLEALPRHETAHAALISDILDIVHGTAVAPPEPGSADTEQLSPTELKVLRYLPTNLSRPEIAGELSVSVNTVNTHIRNIYAKLHAGDRSTAVRRARQQRLLGTGRPR